MGLYVDIKKKLQGFNLAVSFEAGKDAVGLLGASGAGKSMTLRCIAGLETPDSGRIVLNDRVLYDSDKKINLSCQKRKIGFLFQNYALFPHMTVEDNIRFGLGRLNNKEQIEKTGRIISMVHLNGLEKRYPNQLSGGQQQRAALARALVVEPEALLLDEPFSALDEHLRSILIDQLMDSLSEYKGVTLFVTHNMEDAYRVCLKLIVLSDGTKVESGSREKIFKAPSSLEALQLTGCKNICRARKISKGMVEALEWGCKLTVSSKMKDISHIGIHADQIRLADEIDSKNILQCWPSNVIETPFGVTVHINIGNPPSGAKDYHLLWEIPMENWLHMKEKTLPWNICLNPEKLILVE